MLLKLVSELHHAQAPFIRSLVWLREVAPACSASPSPTVEEAAVAAEQMMSWIPAKKTSQSEISAKSFLLSRQIKV